MNHDIFHHIKDYTQRDITVALDVDHHSPYDFPPYIWEGTIDQRKVKIIQNDYPAVSFEDFEFVEYPEELNYTKGDIIKLIDQALRSLKGD